MAWIYLLCAGACEMVWPLGFKYTNGFKENTPGIVATLGIMLLSFWLLSQATAKGIPVGTAYAVWTGIGASGIAIMGMFLFKESHDAVRIGCLAMIVIGVVGLKLMSPPVQNASPSAPQETVAE